MLSNPACSKRSRRAVALALSLLVAACASTGEKRAANQTRAGVQAAEVDYWEEAEFRWLKALAIAALDARALNNLAVRSERAGDFELAKGYYDRALRVASPAERFYVDRNYRQFEPLWERISSGSMEPVEATEFDLPVDQLSDAPAEVGVVEVGISVPDQGPNLAGYRRVLVGNFAPRADSEANINDLAVRYLRRRITERTFFETQDQIEQPLEPDKRGDALFAEPEYWVKRAEAAGADLVLTGELGLTTRQDSQMVRERIRSPDGEIREVARFQDSMIYTIVLDYSLLKGEDGAVLLSGRLQSERPFPVDEGVSDSEAVFETLEALLPETLAAITPRRSEQTRYLIY